MATEKRLIDANELLRIYKKWIPQLILPQDQKDKEAIETCIKVLEDQTTVDAVEVVRCKDCKHWHEETGWCNQHSHFIGAKGEACNPWESNDWKTFDEEDFCSYGERKDND